MANKACSREPETKEFPDLGRALLEQLNIQRQLGLFCDVTLRVENCDFRLHKNVLAAFSPKLHAMLVTMRQECSNLLSLKEVTAAGIGYVIQYWYTAILELNPMHVHDILTAAQYLEMREVEKACIDYLELLPGWKGQQGSLLEPNDTSDARSPVSDSPGAMSKPPYTSPYARARRPMMDINFIENYLKLLSPDDGDGESGKGNSVLPNIPPILPPGGTPGEQNEKNKDGDASADKDGIDDTSYMDHVDDDSDGDQKVQDGETKEKSEKEADADGDAKEEQSEGDDDDEKAEKPAKRKRGRPKKDPKLLKKRQRKATRPRKRRMKKDLDDNLPLSLLIGRRSGKKKVIRYCRLCGRGFENMGALERHEKLHVEKEDSLHSCPVCDKKFQRVSDLSRHKSTHIDFTYQCEQCSERFVKQCAFRTHMEKVHGDLKPFKCFHPGCLFRAPKASHVKEHAAIHSDVKQYACKKCGKLFAQKYGLRIHMGCCYERRDHLCDICGQKFNIKQSLAKHKRIHSGEKPYKCLDCGKSFSDNANYKRHRRIHDNAYPYPCNLCDKRFRHSNSWKAHLKTHDANRDLASPRASRPQAPRQQKHIREHQQNNTPLQSIHQTIMTSLSAPIHSDPIDLHIPPPPPQMPQENDHIPHDMRDMRPLGSCPSTVSSSLDLLANLAANPPETHGSMATPHAHQHNLPPPHPHPHAHPHPHPHPHPCYPRILKPWWDQP